MPDKESTTASPPETAEPAPTRKPRPSTTPGNGGRRWETIQLAIRLGCVVVLTSSIVGFFCLSGKQISVEQIILIIVSGAALAGISIARPGGGGQGATLLGGSMLMLLLLGCQGCAAHQAQIATQSSLTGLAEAVSSGDRALAVAVPELSAAAIERVRARCSGGCDDPLTIYTAEMADVDRAVDGLEVAAEALRVAQVAQDAWVASGELPDAGPLCGALGDAVEPVAGLLDEAGVDVPEQIVGTGGIIELLCRVVARWVRP